MTFGGEKSLEKSACASCCWLLLLAAVQLGLLGTSIAVGWLNTCRHKGGILRETPNPPHTPQVHSSFFYLHNKENTESSEEK